MEPFWNPVPLITKVFPVEIRPIRGGVYEVTDCGMIVTLSLKVSTLPRTSSGSESAAGLVIRIPYLVSSVFTGVVTWNDT